MNFLSYLLLKAYRNANQKKDEKIKTKEDKKKTDAIEEQERIKNEQNNELLQKILKEHPNCTEVLGKAIDKTKKLNITADTLRKIGTLPEDNPPNSTQLSRESQPKPKKQ